MLQVGDGQLTPLAIALSDKLGEALQTVTDKSHEYSWISASLYHLMSSLNSNSQSINPF